MRFFQIISIPEATDDTLQFIFENIMAGFLKSLPFSDFVRRNQPSIAVGCTIELY